MKVARAAFVVIALIGASALASTVHAQSVPVLVGGNCDTPAQPAEEFMAATGPALYSGVPTYSYSATFNPYLLLARLQHWLAAGSVQTPTSGMLSARSVRFASAGRPDARVYRVTWW